MPAIIRMVNTANDDLPPFPPGWYLSSYDLDAEPGGFEFLLGDDVFAVSGQASGRIVITNKQERAMRFADVGAAIAAWKEPSKRVPLRADGEPNRPMTAFTVEIMPVEEERSSPHLKEEDH